jgi:RimJ/RimL family protein N-acetyltransferase
MNIRGAKVKIRNVTRADLHYLVKWKTDPEIADFVRGAPINTTFDIENRRYEKGLNEPDMIRLIIESIDGIPIGYISIGDIDKDNKKAEIGMLIGEKQFCNKGFGTDALIALIKHLFKVMGFNRLSIEVFEYNHRAKKFYEKIGFKVEGVQRQGLVRNKKFQDIYLMGILKDDFNNGL